MYKTKSLYDNNLINTAMEQVNNSTRGIAGALALAEGINASPIAKALESTQKFCDIKGVVGPLINNTHLEKLAGKHNAPAWSNLRLRIGLIQRKPSAKGNIEPSRMKLPV